MTFRIPALCALLVSGFASGQSKVPEWKQLEALEKDQRLAEALRGVEARLDQAIQRNDERDWTRALVKATQLQIGLHGYETAVKSLKERPWPKSVLYRDVALLTYAYAIANYTQAYSWEIRQRERVESKGPVDLKRWSYDQLMTEAQSAFVEVWATREALGAEPIAKLGDYLNPGTYPAHIRGTIRDAVSYLFVQLLANSSAWRADHANEVFRLDAEALIKGDASASKAVKLGDPDVHPLLKLGAVLDDLQAWHAANGRKEAVLETRIERAAQLWQHLTSEAQRKRILADLDARVAATRELPWYSMGRATQASLTESLEDPVAADRIARDGYEAYKDSLGGKQCLAIFKQIEAPEFSLAAMATDGLGERSIQVSHRNLERLYFRAFRLDLDRLVEQWTDYSLLPQGERLEAIVASQRPEVRWSVSLPPTPDFAQHATYVTPPLERYGVYIIAASPDEGFARKRNRVDAVAINVSALVMTALQLGPAEQEVRVLEGQTGKPVAGATVELHAYDWQTKHRRVGVWTTDANGYVHWDRAPAGNGSYFVIAKRGEDRAFDLSGLGFGQAHEPVPRTASLVYTDRSIYRPNQRVRWKVVAYQGRGDLAQYHTAGGVPVTVTLLDANRQKVDSATLTSNAFGSVAGEFVIPSGRVLGAWAIQANPAGNAVVRVEEYKRPTFEAELLAPKASARLNQAAAFTGQAKYYFGQAVTAGKVRWRATREPRYPFWWSWFGLPVGRSQVVANGIASLREDGTFEIRFTPEADPESASSAVTYQYTVSADVTDEGGETRTATRSFRIGFTAVEARIETDAGFFRPGAPAEARIIRTDLDGNPRAGKGKWTLAALVQPKETLLPADEPWPEIPGRSRDLLTPGDRLRPRWIGEYHAERTMRGWADGAVVASGEIAHDEKGLGAIRLSPSAPGAYRLRYETVDEYGAKFETQAELVFASPTLRLAVPLGLWIEERSVSAGGAVRLFVASGLPDQHAVLDVYRPDRPVERRFLTLGDAAAVIELPIAPSDRGGIQVRLSALRDYQFLQDSETIVVPYDDKELALEFATFRDRMRPGAKETFRVTVKGKGGEPLERGAAEVLAYMYDRSLDYFAPHVPPNASMLYQQRVSGRWLRATVGQGSSFGVWYDRYPELPESPPDPQPAYFTPISGYGIGGMGRRSRGRGAGDGELFYGAELLSSEGVVSRKAAKDKSEEPPAPPVEAKKALSNFEANETTTPAPAEAPPPPELRSNFSETAFFFPQLLTDASGAVAFEFTVPDSVTSWNVWAHAVTRELRVGSVRKETRSVKELMVRPYLPRFFREADEAELQVAVNNTGEKDLSGEVAMEISDVELNRAANAEFLVQGEAPSKKFTVAAGKSTTVAFKVKAPRRVGPFAFKVTARAGAFSDGELRPVPVLPSRLHLAQSRFATLHDKDKKTLRFEDLARGDDPTLQTEQLVVTLDAQLFYTALDALPYLIDYPYECSEQTMNRFVSTGIVSSLFSQYPAVAAMAQKMSKRTTQFEAWDQPDPNRKMLLEETPWLREARGGPTSDERQLINVLDPNVARSQRDAALQKLRKMQTSSGGFSWFPGGPPSPYMTLYLLHGFARAAEYRVEIPRDVVQRAWQYVAQHYRSEYAPKLHDKRALSPEFLTFLNYVATAFPDESYLGGALTMEERKAILDYSFEHWREHSPYLKGYLALTLKRMGRAADGRKVFASVMDSAKTTEEQGTFWAAEDRSWLWYNDTIESHAFALRVMLELTPEDARRHGLVQWLLINKKLSHWKSTRATAEVIYALVKYLEKEGALGIREAIKVSIGPRVKSFEFKPDEYTGKKNQIVVEGAEVDPKRDSTIVVEKDTKGFAFASATWHFATDKLPAEERGDFFSVTRKYFRREKQGRETTLQPLEEGAKIAVGDELEVQISIRAKAAAEYVHLADPRAAGLEPEQATSGYRWGTGIAYYEETRDSATNFFFDWVPVGEYTLRYRLRANMAGTFRVGPATLQSMYAPEFNAYSTGTYLGVNPQGKGP